MAVSATPDSRRPDLGDFAWASLLRAHRRQRGAAAITAIVHTRNEERNLPDALRSLDWVDDVLVVDMESEDRTVEIAREHGAEVLTVANVGYVEPARNLALETASGDWVLVLDADERILEPLARTLDIITQSGEVDVVHLHCHNWIAGQFLRASGWLGEYHPRFFRRGYVQWGSRVHAEPKVLGRVTHLPYTYDRPEFGIIHFNYDDLAHFVAKLNRYTDKEADALEGAAPMSWAQLAPQLRAEFIKRYTPLDDGPLSASLAFSMLFYRFIAQAKHWERLGFPDVDLPSEGCAALRDLAHDGRPLHEAGIAAAERGAAAEALHLLRGSVVEQLNLETLNDLAVVCAQTGRPSEAETLLRACLVLDPGCEAARENLAALEERMAVGETPAAAVAV